MESRVLGLEWYSIRRLHRVLHCAAALSKGLLCNDGSGVRAFGSGVKGWPS